MLKSHSVRDTQQLHNNNYNFPSPECNLTGTNEAHLNVLYLLNELSLLFVQRCSVKRFDFDKITALSAPAASQKCFRLRSANTVPFGTQSARPSLSCDLATKRAEKRDARGRPLVRPQGRVVAGARGRALSPASRAFHLPHDLFVLAESPVIAFEKFHSRDALDAIDTRDICDKMACTSRMITRYKKL
ncbi:hypothetical protein EVAR_76531_1 [Eumeta japonica]|uniref:Uncharacterized protein n=1 Tax=Eumeta variegata TaxID=151549 RepID=A0A4C1T891_EUMVA|nr:hypothetical protein EVAR_76531_1 [Eumeta japonica]